MNEGTSDFLNVLNISLQTTAANTHVAEEQLLGTSPSFE
jgi:hypothetical protein